MRKYNRLDDPPVPWIREEFLNKVPIERIIRNVVPYVVMLGLIYLVIKK